MPVWDLSTPEGRANARDANPGWIVDETGLYNPHTGQEYNAENALTRETGQAFSAPAAGTGAPVPQGFSGPNVGLYTQMYSRPTPSGASGGGQTMPKPIAQTQQAGVGAPATNVPGAAGASQTGQWYAGLNGGQPLAPGQNIEDVRRANLYDTGDPLTALRNVMLDMGVNLASPYGASLLRLAPGLANAFRVTNASGAATPATEINEPDMFRRYLGSVLQGSGSGGLFGALRGAAQQATSPGFSQSLMSAANLQNAGGAINPFLQQLLSAGLANDPQAMSGLMTSLLSPMMSRGLGQAYGQTIAERGQAAMRNPDLFAAGNSGGSNADAFYRFIMGMP